MHISNDTVAIMMATYNGGHYLREQIESLLSQTYTEWILFIRDDESKDNTLEIVNEYVKKYPEKVISVANHSDKHGARMNFGCIHEWVTRQYDFRYFMFCDQDDIWLPDKIEKEMMAIKKGEEEYVGPLLIHTDLTVVDEKLAVIAPSYVKFRSINIFLISFFLFPKICPCMTGGLHWWLVCSERLFF